MGKENKESNHHQSNDASNLATHKSSISKNLILSLGNGCVTIIIRE